MTIREATLRAPRPSAPTARESIIRGFLARTQHAPADRRAQAAAMLARAYLYGDLTEAESWEAKTTLLALLDDPSPLVRQALSEACADSARSPRPLVVALSCDAPEVARPVLARSPVLTDADLVDAAALGDEATRAVIAARHHLPHAVSGALAEIAGPDTLLVLAGNATARITAGRMLRMVERHGDWAPLREALLARPDVPPEVRHAVSLAVAQALAALVTARGWLGHERCARMEREAGERAALEACDGAGAAAVGQFVRHLRGAHLLTAGLLLRAVLSGREDFVRAALADLAGLDHGTVARALREPRGFADLHARAGLPEALLPAMQAALSAWWDRSAADARGTGLSRLTVERAIAACGALPGPEARAITALLTRYEVEAARDEAREAARAVAAQAAAREAAARGEREDDAAWRAALDSQRRTEAVQAEASLAEASLAEAFIAATPVLDAWAQAEAAVAAPPETTVAWESEDGVETSEAEAVEVIAEDAVESVAEDGVADAMAPPPAPEPVAAVEIPEVAFNPVGDILDALPGQILERFQAERRRPDDAVARDTTEAVLDGLGAGLLAQYRAGRPAGRQGAGPLKIAA